MELKHKKANELGQKARALAASNKAATALDCRLASCLLPIPHVIFPPSLCKGRRAEKGRGQREMNGVLFAILACAGCSLRSVPGCRGKWQARASVRAVGWAPLLWRFRCLPLTLAPRRSPLGAPSRKRVLA